MKDEPVKDHLGNINKARLLERKYGGDKSAIPTIDYLAVQSKAISRTLPGITRTEVGNLDLNFPRLKAGLTLAGSELNWLFALISSPTVVQGSSYVDNALRRILVPRVGQKVVVKYAGSLPLLVTVYGAARSYGEHIPTFKVLSIIFNPETKLIDLTLFEERQDVAVPLSLQFQYCPSQGFALQSQVSFKDKTAYRNVSVSGDIFVWNQLKVLVKVGSVDFQRDDSQGNPVLAYLQRHGTAQGLTTPLTNGYSLNTPDVSTTCNAPLMNEPYSKISGDFNPIHINPYFSDFASLPATITHGMWSIAATLCYVESIVAQGHPDRMIA